MQHYPVDPVAGGYTGWFLGLCRKIAAKCSRSCSFFRSFSRKRADFPYIRLWIVFVRRWLGKLWFKVIFAIKALIFQPFIAKIRFIQSIPRAYKLAQVNMAYRRKLYSMSVNVSCFILPAPPLFCWYYYTIFRARMEVGIIQRSGENFFSSVCLTGSGSIKSQTQLYFLSVSHTDSSLNPIEEPPPYVFVTPA